MKTLFILFAVLMAVSYVACQETSRDVSDTSTSDKKPVQVTTAVLVNVGNGELCTLLRLSGDFDSQLQHILHKQMISAEERANIISRVLGDVRTTLNQRWQGFKLTPFGSLTTGLSGINSDVDICLQLENYNSSADSYVLQEAEKLFLKQPALYLDVYCMIKPRYARCSFVHVPTLRGVDLVFRNGEGAVYESKIVKYYFNLEERYLQLASFLKYWFKIHNLTGHVTSDRLQNYGLYLLTIFYLQQKNMVPPGFVLQVDAKSHFVDYWDMGFKELPYSSTNTENLHQLLGGFFKYYSEFNFEEYIVSPFTGRPIPRSAYEDIDNFPIEYTLYNNTLKRTVQLMITNDLNCTDVCIQDVFKHNSNPGQRLSHEFVTKFKYLMKSVAAMFDDLPSDSILRAILVTDQHKETVINCNNVTVDGKNEQDLPLYDSACATKFGDQKNLDEQNKR